MAAALLVQPLVSRLRARTTRLGTAAVLAFVVAWSLPIGVNAFSTRLELGSEGSAALATVRDMSADEQDGAVLSNASTRGIIEFTTGLEQPIEGRQPVIEDPDFLDAAIRVLGRTQAYFLTLGEPGADNSGLLRDLGVGWLLVTSDPELLGARDAFGIPGTVIAAARGEPGLELVWERPGIALFGVAQAPPDLSREGPVKRGGWPVWTALLLLGSAGAFWFASVTRGVGNDESGR
jgi:hypothetical protein